MHRLAVAVVWLLFAGSAVAQNPPASNPLAITLAQQSVTALTGGVAMADVTLNANVTSIVGSQYETGTGTFYAKGVAESRTDLSLNGTDNRSDVRNAPTGIPGGAWQTNGTAPSPYAQHNCWTDAAWFFPALSSLSQTANPNFIFSYIGQEQHGSVNTQHIQVYQWSPQGAPSSMLSTIDFYLDVTSSLPVAVSFNAHPDNDMSTNLPTEIDFANYQVVNGVQIAFHFQKIFNGLVVLDVTLTSATFNAGLPDRLFTLQ